MACGRETCRKPDRHLCVPYLWDEEGKCLRNFWGKLKPEDGAGIWHSGDKWKRDPHLKCEGDSPGPAETGCHRRGIPGMDF